MSISTPADSAAGACGVTWGAVAVTTPDDLIGCSDTMFDSPLWDRTANDEGKHEGEHSKPFHDRRRSHRDTENCRLALAGVDRRSATLALQNANVEHRHAHQKPHPEQAWRGCRTDGTIEGEHDDNAIDDDRRRQHRQSDVASVATV